MRVRKMRERVEAMLSELRIWSGGDGVIECRGDEMGIYGIRCWGEPLLELAGQMNYIFGIKTNCKKKKGVEK